MLKKIQKLIQGIEYLIGIINQKDDGNDDVEKISTIDFLNKTIIETPSTPNIKKNPNNNVNKRY